MMARLYSGFWVGVTTVLCVIFTVMFFPLVQEKYGYPQSVDMTLVGIAVIWASYLFRAYIFTQGMEDRRNNPGSDHGK